MYPLFHVIGDVSQNHFLWVLIFWEDKMCVENLWKKFLEQSSHLATHFNFKREIQKKSKENMPAEFLALISHRMVIATTQLNPKALFS